VWSDIIGHSNQIDMLRSNIISGNMHHAYLFAGLVGLGKTLVAKEFFKAVNCLKTPGDPCDVCLSCKKAMSGNHPDLVLVGNGKGGRIKVDDIREMIRGIALKPFEARSRMVIIEPAEMLNIASANALLKNLEEPPESTIFVLISHKPDLLLPTIVSRCQMIRFLPIDGAEFSDRDMDSALLKLTSGVIGGITGPAGDIISDMRKSVISLVKGEDPFEIVSLFISANNKFEVPISLSLSVVESLVRDILMIKLGSDKVINEELFDVDVRSFSLNDIEAVRDCIHEIRRGMDNNINLENALKELFLKINNMSVS